MQYELREEVIEKVKWNVNRDSPEDKLRDFLEWMKAVKRDTIHHVSSCVWWCVGDESDCFCRLDSTSSHPPGSSPLYRKFVTIVRVVICDYCEGCDWCDSLCVHAVSYVTTCLSCGRWL